MEGKHVLEQGGWEREGRHHNRGVVRDTVFMKWQVKKVGDTKGQV